MQFQVPQFIEIEDKIFGPFTIRQFIYIAGGAGLCYIAYALLPFVFALPVVGVIATFSAMLAFYRYNNRPFINFVESAFKYNTTSKLYIWKKEQKTIAVGDNKKAVVGSVPRIAVPKLSESKLKDLTWSLDIRESQNPITGQNNKTNT
jgi:hypothetical protein